MTPAPSPRVRPAAVAGLFYAERPAALERELDAALEQAREVSLAPGRAPKALIVPHAGYVYSGAIAASGYRTLAPARGRIARVVLLGPCHRVPVRGLALPGADAFATPLGEVALDREAVAAIAALPQVVVSPEAHAREHSLEVQLPFLQRWLGAFSLVPLAVGDATPAEVADVIERLWGGDETLVVVSSDLSHFHRYDEACAIDAATARAICHRDPDLGHDQACGATPIAGLLEVARRRDLLPQLLDLRNSGDTAGDRSRVVGYASIAFYPAPAGIGDDADGASAQAAEDDEARGRALVALARAAIAEAFGHGSVDVPAHGWLTAPGATFVTLRAGADLRGCIGSLEPRRALREDVVANALAAAFRDPRFAPLAVHEFAEVTVEVSELGAPEPIDFRDRMHLAAQLRPGEDGVILEHGARRGTFLPQVWESLPDPDDFLDALARKAGIPPARVADCRVRRYRVRKWREREAP